MRVLTAMTVAMALGAACGKKEPGPEASDAAASAGSDAAGKAEPADAEDAPKKGPRRTAPGKPAPSVGGAADDGEAKPDEAAVPQPEVAKPAEDAPTAAAPAADVAVALPPVPDKATEVGCFAMTGDGRAALMAVRSVLTDHNAEPEPEVEDSGISVEWVGEDLGGTLDCFADATTCAGEDTPARTAFITKHAMTGCPAPTMVAKACGAARTLVSKDDALWLEGGDGAAKKLMEFTVDEHDGGSHEAFAAAWQHPSGGPLFVGVTNSDTGLEEYLARAVPVAKLGRCE